MPIKRKIADFADELGEYLVSVLRHWRPLVSGAALGLFVWGYGAMAARPLPNAVYLWLLVCAAIIASYLAWRDQYRVKNAHASELPSHELAIRRLDDSDAQLRTSNETLRAELNDNKELVQTLRTSIEAQGEQLTQLTKTILEMARASAARDGDLPNRALLLTAELRKAIQDKHDQINAEWTPYVRQEAPYPDTQEHFMNRVYWDRQQSRNANHDAMTRNMKLMRGSAETYNRFRNRIESIADEFTRAGVDLGKLGRAELSDMDVFHGRLESVITTLEDAASGMLSSQ